MMPGNPIKLSDTHDERFSPPPLLGQHTDEILASLGKSTADITALRQIGAI
jgi:crotonobetainyl-CoA:carnitine CoA-transferase CaiB-like acyl-CoA transferase